MSHLRSLAGLSIAQALCTAAPAQTSDSISRIGSLLGEIQLLAAAVPSVAPPLPSETRAHAVIEAALDKTSRCHYSAKAYLLLDLHIPGIPGLSVGQHGKGSTTWIISGSPCSQQFTFASGTTMDNIVAAINRFTSCTGVIASPAPDTCAFVQLESIATGPDAFVSVTQTHGPHPLIFIAPPGGIPHFALTTFGADGLMGDLDCDFTIGPADLQSLLVAWGPVALGSPADLYGDGVVNGIDLGMLLGAWSQPTVNPCRPGGPFPGTGRGHIICCG